ncbi:BnaAnng31090D, partial [Brassica napus]
MILSRSVSVLHSCRISSAPKLISHKLKVSFPLAYGSSALISLNRSEVKWVRVFASATETETEVERKGNDTFFADQAVSWKSLGLSDKVSVALRDSGFGRPSLTQAVCIPSILSGKDVVVAAETGSGKTHGYLAPIIHQLTNTNTALDSEGEEKRVPLKTISLVLCPNVMLCEQVVRMVNGLLGEDGHPLLRVEAVCGSQGWPDKQPDIIVSTPAALLNNIEPKRNRRVEFLRSVKYVVFDEADMLLCGSFQNQIIRLINMLRFDEKQVSRLATSKFGKPLEIDAESSAQFDLENEDDADFEEDGSISDEEEEEELEYLDDTTQIPTVENGAGPDIRKGWRRVRKIYTRSKQYIFIAATLPVNGKKTAGGLLKHMFQDAVWVSGNFLHRNSPRLKQKWVEVTVDTQVDALIEAVNNSSTDRTMVFANTVEAVEAVADILEKASIQCYRYHKNHTLEERANILADFRENGGVFVCTDAAARGVDVPNVSHVIQADFSSSAVDFLHRIGRTARAGQYGTVTSLYTEANRDLVEAIREAVKTGQP